MFLDKLKYFVTLIISGVSIVSAWGQTPQQCLALAQQHYKLQHYQEVIELYERITFFNKDILTQEDYQQWAQCYLETKNIEKAVDMYSVAANVAITDSTRYHFLFKVILCQILQSSYQESLISLYNLPDSLPRFYTHSRDLYMGITQFQLNDFSAADLSFLKYFAGSSYETDVRKLLEKNKKLAKRYNPKKAQILSILLPGLGQFYYGDVRNGLNSMLLSGLLIGLGVNRILNYTFLDAIMSVGPWYQRYYVGGFTRAKKGAEDKIERERQKIISAILHKADHQ